jgi:hypothetical protein
MREKEELLTAAVIAQILSDQFNIGDTKQNFRLVRHLSAQGLLETVSLLNTGSGRRRLYARSSLVYAAVLLRLHELGATVGLMKELMSALRLRLNEHYNTTDILKACERLKRPTLFIIVPDKKHAIRDAVRLVAWNTAIKTIKPDMDVLMIQIDRFR